MPSWTVIAESGERFSGFDEYVASVNDDGAIAFQARRRDGGAGVFVGRGDAVAELVGNDRVRAVTSHPDVDDVGAAAFYGELPDGTQAVFLIRDGRLDPLAVTFAAIGPLGPTLDETGTVAFRGDRVEGVSGIHTANDGHVVTVAEIGDEWRGFEGLPVVDRSARVVFRADRVDCTQGIYAARDGAIEPLAVTGGRFASLGRFPSVDADGTVAFAATLEGGGAGVFTVDSAGVTTAVTTDGAFASYRGALIGNARAIVLIATPHGGELGLFAGPDPVADRILALGDPLFDSTVTDFAANPVSINATGRLAVRAALADGRELILATDAPDGPTGTP